MANEGTHATAVMHEMHNSLTAVLGYLDLLSRRSKGPLNARQEELVARISRNANRTRSLLAELSSAMPGTAPGEAGAAAAARPGGNG
jgi:signal transduction histidine kinase